MAAKASTIDPETSKGSYMDVDEFLELLQSCMVDPLVSQTDCPAAGTKHRGGGGGGGGAAGPGVGAASKRKVQAALLNIRSVQRKIPYMINLIKEKKLNLFLITETWLKKGNEDKLKKREGDFKIYHRMRAQSRGGGVAILVVRNEMDYTSPAVLQNFNPTTFEHVAANLKHHTWEHHVLFINVYRPPESSREKTNDTMTKFELFKKEFEDLLTEAKKINKKLIVTGDFNIWFETDNHQQTQFFELLNNHGLTQHVNDPTHNNGHTLDLVISNVGISNIQLEQTPPEISDHFTVYFNVEDQ